MSYKLINSFQKDSQIYANTDKMRLMYALSIHEHNPLIDVDRQCEGTLVPHHCLNRKEIICSRTAHRRSGAVLVLQLAVTLISWRVWGSLAFFATMSAMNLSWMTAPLDNWTEGSDITSGRATSCSLLAPLIRLLLRICTWRKITGSSRVIQVDCSSLLTTKQHCKIQSDLVRFASQFCCILPLDHTRDSLCDFFVPSRYNFTRVTRVYYTGQYWR